VVNNTGSSRHPPEGGSRHAAQTGFRRAKQCACYRGKKKDASAKRMTTLSKRSIVSYSTRATPTQNKAKQINPIICFILAALRLFINAIWAGALG